MKIKFLLVIIWASQVLIDCTLYAQDGNAFFDALTKNSFAPLCEKQPLSKSPLPGFIRLNISIPIVLYADIPIEKLQLVTTFVDDSKEVNGTRLCFEYGPRFDPPEPFSITEFDFKNFLFAKNVVYSIPEDVMKNKDIMTLISGIIKRK